MPDTPQFGVGIVGFGFIGKVHAYAYRNIPLFYDPPAATARLVGVCTSRDETARKARQQGQFEFATTSFDDLLASDDIDIINICTPNHLHRDQVIAALEAGKHVYCDKPLTVSATDAAAIADAVAANPRLSHGMAFHMRFIPATMRARQLVQNGFVGQAYHFRASYYHSGYSDPTRPLSWRLRKETGGGALSDLGSHVIDLMRYIIGDYAAVRATTETYIESRPVEKGAAEKGPVEVDDYVCLQARMGNGALGFIDASRFATGTQDDMSFEIYGEQGGLKFDMMDPNYLYAYDDTKPAGDFGGNRGWTAIECVQRYPEPSSLPSPKLPIGWMRFHLHAIYDFLSAVTARNLGTATLLDGVQTQFVDEAVRRSAQTGQWTDIEREA